MADEALVPEPKRTREHVLATISHNQSTIPSHFAHLIQPIWSSVFYLPFIPPFVTYEQVDDFLDLTDLQQINCEFFWTLGFDKRSIAAFMAAGLLPMTITFDYEGEENEKFTLLTPKLHKERAVIILEDCKAMHVGKSTKRKARSCNWQFSVDLDFDGVVLGIRKQHGESCWIRERLCASYRDLTNDNNAFARLECFSVFFDVCRVHSIEIWEDGVLVAGELGYVVGNIYTSLSGFRTASCSGKIQLYCLAAILIDIGFCIWDLGMQLGYKEDLGAFSIDQSTWLDLVRSNRGVRRQLTCSKISAAELLARF